MLLEDFAVLFWVEITRFFSNDVMSAWTFVEHIEKLPAISKFAGSITTFHILPVYFTNLFPGMVHVRSLTYILVPMS